MAHCERRSSRDRAEGFTLIELLVVISIIAVLLAIIMPAMRKIKEMARDTACKSNLRNIGLAVTIYLDDFERKIPNTGSSNGFLWDDASGNPLQPGSGNGTYWGTFYRPYLKETKIFGCPSLQRVPEGLIYTYTDYPDPAAVIQHAAYGLNHHSEARGRNTNDIYRLSEFLYCSDHAEPRPDGGTDDCFHNNDTPGAMNLTAYRQGGNRSQTYRQIFRHSMRYADPLQDRGPSQPPLARRSRQCAGGNHRRRRGTPLVHRRSPLAPPTARNRPHSETQ